MVKKQTNKDHSWNPTFGLAPRANQTIRVLRLSQIHLSVSETGVYSISF